METLKLESSSNYIITVLDPKHYFSDIDYYSQLVYKRELNINKLKKIISKLDYQYVIILEPGWLLTIPPDLDYERTDRYTVLSKYYFEEFDQLPYHTQRPVCTLNKVEESQIINWPDIRPDDYTIFLGSIRQDQVEIIRQTIPDVVHYDGHHIPSFSYLVNKCIRACPTEIFIFISDKVRPTQEQITNMVKLIKSGYAFVAMYSFACFGFKKDFIRTIGFFSEAYVGGGHEDHDIINLIVQHKLPFYHTLEMEYIKKDTTWSYKLSKSIYYEKWWTESAFKIPSGTDIRKKLKEMTMNKKMPDLVYDGTLGPIQDPNWYDPKLKLRWQPIENNTSHDTTASLAKFPLYMRGIDTYKSSELLKIRHFRINNRLDPVRYLQLLLNLVKLGRHILDLTDQPSVIKSNLNADQINENKIDQINENKIDQINENKIDLVAINCYTEHRKCVSWYNKVIMKLPIMSYIILYQIKRSNQYDGNIYHGNLHAVWRGITKSKSLSIVTIPCYPGMVVIQKIS